MRIMFIKSINSKIIFYIFTIVLINYNYIYNIF